MLSGYCDTSCLLFKVIIQSIFVFFFSGMCEGYGLEKSLEHLNGWPQCKLEVFRNDARPAKRSIQQTVVSGWQLWTPYHAQCIQGYLFFLNLV